MQTVCLFSVKGKKQTGVWHAEVLKVMWSGQLPGSALLPTLVFCHYATMKQSILYMSESNVYWKYLQEKFSPTWKEVKHECNTFVFRWWSVALSIPHFTFSPTGSEGTGLINEYFKAKGHLIMNFLKEICPFVSSDINFSCFILREIFRWSPTQFPNIVHTSIII